MSNQTSENYLDQLLSSLGEGNQTTESEQNSVEEPKMTETAEEFVERQFDMKSMSARDEDEFLRQFEEELALGEFGKDFDLLEKELTTEEGNTEDVYSSIESVVEEVQKADEESATIESPYIPDFEPEETPLAETLGVDSLELAGDIDIEMPEEATPLEESAEPEGNGKLDLSGLGDDDLMDLLATSEDLSDIGELLSNMGEKPIQEGLDAISGYADAEMANSQGGAGQTNEAEKLGFFAKLGKLLFGEDEPEVEEPVDSRTKEEIKAAKKKEKEEKKKEKQAKKEQELKDKPPKEKKPKKEKPPKEKKEKKPAEVDNSPPIPKGPAVMIFVMVGSLAALVILVMNVFGNMSNYKDSRTYFEKERYIEAYSKINGLEVSEDNEIYYQQVALLAAVQGEYESYLSFKEHGREIFALDSIVSAAGRVYKNTDLAQELNCSDRMYKLEEEIRSALIGYGMTWEEAIELYELSDRDDYSIALQKKAYELGLQ